MKFLKKLLFLFLATTIVFIALSLHFQLTVILSTITYMALATEADFILCTYSKIDNIYTKSHHYWTFLFILSDRSMYQIVYLITYKETPSPSNSHGEKKLIHPQLSLRPPYNQPQGFISPRIKICLNNISRRQTYLAQLNYISCTMCSLKFIFLGILLQILLDNYVKIAFRFFFSITM